jgi:hypothetical protein
MVVLTRTCSPEAVNDRHWKFGRAALLCLFVICDLLRWTLSLLGWEILLATGVVVRYLHADNGIVSLFCLRPGAAGGANDCSWLVRLSSFSDTGDEAETLFLSLWDSCKQATWRNLERGLTREELRPSRRDFFSGKGSSNISNSAWAHSVWPVDRGTFSLAMPSPEAIFVGDVGGAGLVSLSRTRTFSLAPASERNVLRTCAT